MFLDAYYVFCAFHVIEKCVFSEHIKWIKEKLKFVNYNNYVFCRSDVDS